jgi:uncharacterized protein YlxW (UPF0749 family)
VDKLSEIIKQIESVQKGLKILASEVKTIKWRKMADRRTLQQRRERKLRRELESLRFIDTMEGLENKRKGKEEED